jgi:hypothetical protein
MPLLMEGGYDVSDDGCDGEDVQWDLRILVDEDEDDDNI